MENETIGNQQATQNEVAWFAGFFDGEGSLGIYGYKRYKSSGYSYTPKFQLASTSAHAIKHCVDILHKMGVNAKIYQKEPQKKNHKEAWQIYFTKFSDMVKVLPLIKDHLVIKKPHADLVLSFVMSRIEKGINRGGNGHINSYDEKEKDTIESLRTLNYRGVLNDYTPNTVRELEPVMI
jgi:hypothetical protein